MSTVIDHIQTTSTTGVAITALPVTPRPQTVTTDPVLIEALASMLADALVADYLSDSACDGGDPEGNQP